LNGDLLDEDHNQNSKNFSKAEEQSQHFSKLLGSDFFKVNWSDSGIETNTDPLDGSSDDEEVEHVDIY